MDHRQALTHVYLGDKWTEPILKGQPVTLARRPDGKVITGRGNALMILWTGRPFVGLLRRTRLTPDERARRKADNEV